MRTTTMRRERSIVRGRSKHVLGVLCVLALGIGVAACGAIDDVISFSKYIDATVDVVEANGMEVAEGDANLDCEGSTETNVTCTAETTDGRSIESTGENLGEDTATLVVTVDGEVLFEGLLKDARNS